jgi:D-alanyl-D-alanine carboxypeptidase
MGLDQPNGPRHVHCMKLLRAPALGVALGSIVLGPIVAAVAAATPARSEALILVDADSGKVLRAENATYPWYPASTTKLMTLYMTLSAIRDHRITFDTLFTVSRTAAAQSPTKMGFPIGTQVTVDNALKMMMVKSANDMAVMLAEGISGSVDNFAEEMTNTAHGLGMTETNYVNPNGLPADGQITSARDLAILARALIREFPQYDFYWHIPAIKYGRRVVRNYNPLLGRYPGTDGMKTGFICASGFNMVATATRDNKHLIAVVLGAPSGAARAVKAAELLETGFTQNPLAWLVPSLGSVDALAPIDAAPANLKDQMCGGHRKRPAAEDEDIDADASGDSGNGNASSGDATPQFSFLLSALRAPTPKNANLLGDAGPVVPTVVYTGPTRTQAEIDKLATLPVEEASGPAKKKKKSSTKTAVAKPADDKAMDDKTTDEKPTAAKPASGKKGGGAAWTPMSSSTLSANPPPELGASSTTGTPAQKKPAKPHQPAKPSPPPAPAQ